MGNKMAKYRNPIPTVDIIIEISTPEKSGIILIERRNPPFGWALPGGFVDYGESLEQAAIREALEETSLHVKLSGQFHTYSDPGRDPRQHTITTVYTASATGTPKAADDAINLDVFQEDNLPKPIVFDHALIIHDYFQCKFHSASKDNQIKKLSQALNATSDGIWEWNFKTNTLAFSPNYYTMLGYQPNEFPATYDSWMNLIHPEDQQKALAVASDYLESKIDRYENEFRMRTKDNTYRWIRTKARVVERDPQGEAVIMIGNHEDITERKLMRQRLNLLTDSVDHALAGFAIIDENHNFVYINNAYLEMWGYDTTDNVLGTSLVTHCADINMPQKIIEHVDKKGSGDFEYIAKRKDGSCFDVFIRVSAITDIDGKRYYHGFYLDMSDRKATAKRLKEYAEEQKVLVREIHHRVKNNLEVIISLIEMRARSIEDASLQLVFSEIKERIWAIAYVHKELYDSHSFLYIDFKAYLENLTNEICNLYVRSDIQISHDFADIHIDIETAIPCSLAYIEMISNAFKHAFPREIHPDYSQTIHVKFYENSDTFTLLVKDNGKGLPSEIDWKSPKTIGFRLINILTKQLNGDLNIHTAKETEFRLTFPKRKEMSNQPGDIV
jgi:8-oxo-dGTP diphosphatase